MKQLLPVLLFLSLSLPVTAQTDRQGNPVFNSVSVKTITLGDSLLLISSYYTLGNNLENKRSSVYISDHPTTGEVAHAALTLPSNHYMLTRRDSVVAMLMVRPDKTNDTAFELVILQPGGGAAPKIEPLTLRGRIPELRAAELIRNRYDTTAVTGNGYLRFNKKNYRIIPNGEIEEQVLRIIRANGLETRPASDMLLLPKERLYDLIREASGNGQSLDFWKDITDKNRLEGIQVEKGVFAQRINGAYYNWGKAAAENGVESADDAVILIKSIRPATTARETEYVRIGFRKAYNYE